MSNARNLENQPQNHEDREIVENANLTIVLPQSITAVSTTSSITKSLTCLTQKRKIENTYSQQEIKCDEEVQNIKRARIEKIEKTLEITKMTLEKIEKGMPVDKQEITKNMEQLEADIKTLEDLLAKESENESLEEKSSNPINCNSSKQFWSHLCSQAKLLKDSIEAHLQSNSAFQPVEELAHTLQSYLSFSSQELRSENNMLLELAPDLEDRDGNPVPAEERYRFV